MSVDLGQIRSTWLQQCGPCDLGMPEYGCTHPGEDHRPVMAQLVNELERLRAAVKRIADLATHGTTHDLIAAAVHIRDELEPRSR